MTTIEIQRILALLPHRYPFLLIDRVLEIKPGESLVALKNVTINEHFFVGHFPEQPVMPGVLLLEALAQAGAVLAYESTQCSAKEGVMYYFAGIDQARFRRVIVPGDQLILKVQVLKAKRDVWKLAGEIYVGDELACSAEFMSARKANGSSSESEA
jgi:3-hydroxyacyl-[acyl-carrier-protein] dehydratase